MVRRGVQLVLLGTIGFLSLWAAARFGGWFQVHDIRVIFVNDGGPERKGYVSPLDVKNLTGLRDGYNILRLHSENVRARLRRHAWIKDARIKVGLLKGIVEIYVQERKPVGRVEDTGGNGYLVDAEGVILGAAEEGTPVFMDLPFSPEAGRVPLWVAEILGFYRNFTRCTELFPRIYMDARGSVTLYPLEEERPSVRCGLLEDFYSLVPELEKLLYEVDISRFETIDCRLGDGCVLKPRVEGGRESG